jgi:hypothetical protein
VALALLARAARGSVDGLTGGQDPFDGSRHHCRRPRRPDRDLDAPAEGLEVAAA